ncbi:threonine/serine ThrE exporter family protein [Ornithinimicrobium sp. Y1847]|uniref:threonine/serine ThrE exporter family protein n=1 Tax=unclassified Ornithinimicrobium TaxID=2615080 RepID=UPI003B66B7F4
MGRAPAVSVGTHESRDRRLLAWLGAGLLAGGMPVHEVEEDVHEVAWTLGYQRAQVACSPTGLMVALRSGEAATFEQVDGGLRLDQLADVLAVQAELRSGRMAVQDGLARLGRLRAQPHRYRTLGLVVGGLLTGVGIGLILAPALSSLLFTLAVAVLTPAFVLLGTRGPTWRTLTPFLAAFTISLLAFLAAGVGWLSAPLWTLVAPIAVLLPGALIVTGLTELAAGAMVAGSSRLAYGLVQLLLFVLGVGAALAVVGVAPESLQEPRPVDLGWWAPLLGVIIITAAISLMESVPARQIPWLGLTVLATFLAQALTMSAVQTRWAGAFAGAVVAALLSTLIEYVRPELPRMVAFLPSFWLLVPGSLGLISLTQVEIGPGAAALAVVDVVVVVTAIALGVLVGSALARPLRHVARQIGLAHLLRTVRQAGSRGVVSRSGGRGGRRSGSA